MNQQPYTKRELDLKFDSLEHRLFDREEGFLPRIEGQTIYTNGTVRWTVKMIYLALGGLAILTPAAMWLTSSEVANKTAIAELQAQLQQQDQDQKQQIQQSVVQAIQSAKSN